MITTQTWIRVGTAGVGFVLLFVALFLSWWTLSPEVGGAAVDDTTYKPFSAPANSGLGTEVAVTGIFAILALVGVGALVGLQFAALPRWVRPGVAGLTVAFGVTAILYTMLAWPDDNIGFFDETTTTAPTPFGPISVTVSAAAGAGWYLAIIGGVLAPLAAGVLELVGPGAPGPTSSATPPMASVAPPTAAPASATAAPAPVVPSTPTTPRRTAPAPGKKALRPVSKAKRAGKRAA